ncbi:MAG: SMI1/KNR4 family protein [Phycisphaerales bacterium]|nr:SMI1/KNR4 family protein [Phycisphaerales bacterium]
MKSLIDRILHDHEAERPASLRQIAAAERRLGFPLDIELRAFYRAMNGAWLFRNRAKGTFRYRPLPLTEIRNMRRVFLLDDDEPGPGNWYSFCELMDSNFVGAEIDPSSGRIVSLRDCFHEVVPDRSATIVARNLREFLIRALDGGDRVYWL